MRTWTDFLGISNDLELEITEQICYLIKPVIQFSIALACTLPIEEHRPASRTANP